MDAKPSPARSKGDLREAGKKRLEEFRQKRQQKGATKPSDEQRSKLGHESESEAASSFPDGPQAGDSQQEETTEKESRSEEEGKRLEVLVEEFQRKLEAAVAENDLLVQEKQSVSRRFNEQMERLAKLEEGEGRLENDRKRLEALVEELQRKLEEKDVLLEHNQAASLKLIDRMEALQKENEKLREQESRWEQDREKLEDMVEGLRTKLEAAVSVKVELLKENETVSQQFNEAMEISHQEHEKLREKERKLEADCKKLEELVGDLQTKLDAAVAEKHDLAKENQMASEQLDKQRAKALHEKEEMLVEQRQKQSRLEEDRKKLEALVAELQTKLDDLAAEKNELVKESQEALHRFNEQRSRYQEEVLAELRKKESKLEEDRRNLEVFAGELQRRLDVAVAKNDELVIENQTISRRFNEQMEKYQHEGDEVAKLKEKEGKFEDEKKKLEVLGAELQTKLDVTLAEKDELVKESERASHQINKLRASYQREQEEMLAELRKKECRMEEDRKLEALVGELQRRLDGASAEKEELVMQNQLDSQRFNEQMERYQQQRDEVAKLKEKGDMLEENRKKLEALVGELQSRLEAAVLERDELDRKNQTASERFIEETQRYQQEHVNVVAKLKEDEAKLQGLVGELRAAAAMKDVEINDRTERWKQEHEEVLAELRNKESFLEDERKKLQSLVEELHRNLEAVLAEKDDLINEKQTASQRFNEQLRQYQEDILMKATEQEIRLEEKQRTMVEKLQRSEEDRKKVAEELERSKEDKNALEAMIEGLQSKLEEKDVLIERNTRVNEQIEGHQSEHANLRHELEKIEADNQRQLAEIHQYQASCEELRHQLERESHEKCEMANRLEKLQSQFEEEKRSILEEKKLEQVHANEEVRKALLSDVEKFALFLRKSSPQEPSTSYCEVLKGSFQSITDLFRANEKERRDLLNKIEDQSKLLEDLEKAASGRVEEQAARLTLQDENMRLLEQVALLQHQMQETADSTEQVKRQLQDVKTRLHNEHAGLESLEAENQKLENQLRQLRNGSQDELTSVRRQLQDTKGAAEAIESRLLDVNRKLMEDQGRLESLEAEKQQLLDEVLRLRRESQDRELQRQHERAAWGYNEEIIRRLESLFHSQHQMTTEKLEKVAVEAGSITEEAHLRVSGLQSNLDLLEADILEQELQNKRVRLLTKEAVNLLAPGEYFDADAATEACVAAGLSIVARRVQAKDDELHFLLTEKEAAVSAVAEKMKSIQGLLVKEQDMIDELLRVRAHEEQLQQKIEQENKKFLSTKEKLNLAVTKGKGLIQERDVLRKSIAELETRSAALDELLSKLKVFTGEANVDILTKVEMFVEEFRDLRENAAVAKDRIGQLREELSVKAQAIMTVAEEKGELQRKLDSVTAEQSQQKLQLEQKLEVWSEQLLRIFHTVARVLSTEAGEDISWSESGDDIIKQLELVISVLVSKFSTTILQNTGLSDELTARGVQVKFLEEAQLRLQEEHALKDAELRSVMHKSEKAISELVQQLESSKAMVSSLNEDQTVCRKKLEEALQEQDRMQQELLESEQRLGVVREKLGLAIKKGKSVSQQRDELKQMLADKSAAMEALLLSYQALEDALSAAKMLQAENERVLRDEVRTLTSTLDESRMLLQGASENETSLREQLNAVTGSLKATSEEKRLVQEELKEISSHFKEAHRRLEEMEQAEQQLQTALDSANNQRRLYEQDQKALEERLDQVLELVVQSDEKKVAALGEVELMALELLRLAAGGNVIPSRPQTATKRSQTSFALSMTGLDQLKEWHERELHVFVDKIFFTQQLLHKGIEVLSPLKQMKAEMAEESVDGWLEAVKSLQVQISSKDAELESLTTCLRDANEEIASLSQQLDELQTVIEDNHTAMDSMESARSKAVGKLTYTVGHLTELQRQCEAMLVEIENLHVNLSSCKEENVSLNEKIKLLEADAQDRNSLIMQLQKALVLILAKTNKQETKAADTDVREPLVLIDSLGTQTQRLLHENETLHATIQSKDVELQELSRRLVEVASFNVHDTGLRAGNVAEPSVVEIEELEQAPRHTTAAHFRSQKKALVSDHVVVDMDSRPVAELEEKGHGFKSLGLVRFFPRACHQFGDRLDALCLSAGKYFTKQPVARLFFIVYSICIHFWLISTLTMGKR